MLAIYAGLIGLASYMFVTVPQGFVPQQDQGYLILSFSLPSGASAFPDQRGHPQGREHRALDPPALRIPPLFAGFSGATRTNAPDSGAIFAVEAPFEERIKQGLTSRKLVSDLRAKLGEIKDANIFVIAPPTLRGIGIGGGFSMYIEDRARARACRR